jgi:glucokinase
VTQFALGVDIGATNTKVALVRNDGDVQSIESFRTGHCDPGQLITGIRDAAARCQGAKSIIGAGATVAGFINAARDQLSYNPNLEWLAGFPLRDALAEALGVPVTLEVDSNSSCLGEYRFGVGSGSHRFLCLVAGTGLGVGMIIDGALVRFMGECIGDAGHVVVDANGPDCPCGGRGCAEVMVSERSIVHNAQSGTTLRDVMDSAREGNSTALEVLQAAGNSLGIAMASLSQMFFPDRIALAGGLAEAGDLVLPFAEASFRRAVNSEARASVAVVKAALGWRATVIGAAVPLFNSQESAET